MLNGHSEVRDVSADGNSDTHVYKMQTEVGAENNIDTGDYQMQTDVNTESDTDTESEVDHTTLLWGRNLDSFPSIPRFRGKSVCKGACMHMYVHACVCACACSRKHGVIGVSVWECAFRCVCVCVCACAQARVCTHV